jgi:hypothetical protein
MAAAINDIVSSFTFTILLLSTARGCGPGSTTDGGDHQRRNSRSLDRHRDGLSFKTAGARQLRSASRSPRFEKQGHHVSVAVATPGVATPPPFREIAIIPPPITIVMPRRSNTVGG